MKSGSGTVIAECRRFFEQKSWRLLWPGGGPSGVERRCWRLSFGRVAMGLRPLAHVAGGLDQVEIDGHKFACRCFNDIPLMCVGNEKVFLMAIPGDAAVRLQPDEA